MGSLITLFDTKKMVLLVDLPVMDLNMAEAVVSAGADVLHFTLNLQGFRSFEEELEELQKIKDTLSIPMGISLALDSYADEDVLKSTKRLNMDFLSMPIEYLTPSMIGLRGVNKILALNSDYTLDEVVRIAEAKFDAVIAAITPRNACHTPLQVGDLQQYISIVLSAGLPVIIPTQKNIKLSEIAILSDTGAKGLLVTNIFNGHNLAHFSDKIKEYRQAIDAIE